MYAMKPNMAQDVAVDTVVKARRTGDAELIRRMKYMVYYLLRKLGYLLLESELFDLNMQKYHRCTLKIIAN